MIGVRTRLTIAFVVLGVPLGCGDRAPAALWPDPPAPTLARPIGIPDPAEASGSAPADVEPSSAEGSSATGGVSDAEQPAEAEPISPAGDNATTTPAPPSTAAEDPSTTPARGRRGKAAPDGAATAQSPGREPR